METPSCVSLNWSLHITLTDVAAFNNQGYIRYLWKHVTSAMIGKNDDCDFCNNSIMLMKIC